MPYKVDIDKGVVEYTTNPNVMRDGRQKERARTLPKKPVPGKLMPHVSKVKTKFLVPVTGKINVVNSRG